MASELATLFRDLFYLREYRAGKRKRIPWRLAIAYFRNLIRHRALKNWPGGYVVRTDGQLVYAPAHVDSAAGHRLFKPRVIFGLIDSLCKADDVVIDIGANVGEYTFQLAQRVGPKGRIIAFEPVPYLAETVAKTARINRHDWVEVHQVAMSASDGTAEFSVEKGNSGGSRLGCMKGDFSQIKVDTIRLDSFLKSRPDITRIDLVKIDVEGFEDQVLLGARETLARFRPALMMETGFESREQREVIHNILVELSYELIGIEVPGGLAEISLEDYKNFTKTLADIRLSNILLMPAQRHA